MRDKHFNQDGKRGRSNTFNGNNQQFHQRNGRKSFQPHFQGDGGNFSESSNTALEKEYNPMEVFKSAHKKKKEPEIPEPTIQHTENNNEEAEEDEPSGSSGDLLSKFDKFKSVWNDLDDKAVTVDRNPKKHDRFGQQKGVDGFKSDKSRSFNDEQIEEETKNQVESVRQRTKSQHGQSDFVKSALRSGMEACHNRKIKFDQEPETSNGFKTEKPDIVNKDQNETVKPQFVNRDQKEVDNKKRIESLRERTKSQKAQQDLVRSALRNGLETTQNRKIKFDSEPEDTQPAKQVNQTSSGVSSNKKMKLFDNEDDEDEEDFDFSSRPHLDGGSGKKLLELQSRYGDDPRFKLDHRFADDDDAQEETEDSLQNEKNAQLSILNSMMPNASNSNRFNDAITISKKAFVRFDPTAKDHSEFEKVASTSWKKKKTAEPTPVPEVSEERFYQTSGPIEIGKGEGFSLLKSLGRLDDDDKETSKPSGQDEDGEPIKKVTQNEAKTEDAKSSKPSTDSSQMSFLKNVGMWQESFFLKKNDARLKEVMEFLRKPPEEERFKEEGFTKFSKNMRHRAVSKQKKFKECLVKKQKRWRHGDTTAMPKYTGDEELSYFIGDSQTVDKYLQGKKKKVAVVVRQGHRQNNWKTENR